MAEDVKKVKPQPKAKAKAPAKSSTKKTSAKAAATNGTAKTNGVPSNLTQMKVPYERVAQLAHQFWAERGHQHGHHEDDWFRAEQELRGKAS
jgi:hypothetical protein